MSVSIFRAPPSTEGAPLQPLVETHEVLANPTAFPTVWNGAHRYMMPGLSAVWSDSRKTFQLVQTVRDRWPLLELECVETQRTKPFYFAMDPRGTDTASRTITVYRPRARIHTHIDVGIWFTGGWLCKRTGNQLVPVIPLMGISDHRVIRFGSTTNPGMFVSQDYLDWQTFQTPSYTTHILRNRLPAAVPPLDQTKAKSANPVPVPEFVARALLRDAQRADDQTCPITMEPLVDGSSAVTSCFHVFNREALEEWMARQGASCPVCKQTCAVTEI